MMKKSILVVAVALVFILACLPSIFESPTSLPANDLLTLQTFAMQEVLTYAAGTTTAIALTGTATPGPTNTSTVQPISLNDFNATHVVDDLAVNIDGRTIAVVANGFHQVNSGESGVWLWDINDPSQPVASFGILLPSPNSVAFSRDGQLLAISGCKPVDDPYSCIQSILVLNWKTRDTLREISAEGRAISRIYFSFDDQMLAAQDLTGIISIWNLETGLREFSFKSAKGILYDHFAFSPDGQTVVLGVACGVELWNLKTTSRIKMYEDLGCGAYTAPALAFNSNGHLLAVGGCVEFGFETCLNYKVTVLDLEDGKKIAELFCNCGYTSIEFSPDNQLLALGSFVGLRLWNFQTREQASVPDLSDVSIFDLGFSPDGNTLIIGSATGLHIIKLSEFVLE